MSYFSDLIRFVQSIVNDEDILFTLTLASVPSFIVTEFVLKCVKYAMKKNNVMNPLSSGEELWSVGSTVFVSAIIYLSASARKKV